MTSHLSDVSEFHQKFGIGYNGPPRHPEVDLAVFRLKFLAEELRELGEALGFNVYLRLTPASQPKLSMVNALDALIDLEYVQLGTVHLLGFGPIYEQAWDRVHNANMQKVRGRKITRTFSNEQWDVTKPEGWQPPDLNALFEL